MTPVLVVDDKEGNLYLLRALLTGHQYEVEEARHGAEALVKARQSPPDLVVSDLLMPVMDGYMLLRQWKADENLKKIPFVVYTATYTEPKNEQLALSLGADAFIVKPAEPDVFMNRLREIAQRVLQPPPPAAPPTHLYIAVPEQEEAIHLQEYNQVLIHKLEDKMFELERTNRKLTQEIAERERARVEIQKQLDELRRWEQATLNRESRVQDLKREVNELCSELALPSRYPSEVPAAKNQPADPMNSPGRNPKRDQ